MKQYLLVVLLALCSCVRLDLERDIVAGQDSAVCWMTPLPDYRTNAKEINALAAQYLKDLGVYSGIMMMDFAGVKWSNGVKVSGDALVSALIDCN